MTNEEQKLREFVSKYVNDDNEPTFLSDLTAILEQHKEMMLKFTEWCLAEVSNNKKRHPEYSYMIWIDGTGLGFTCIEDVFDYWLKNVKK